MKKFLLIILTLFLIPTSSLAIGPKSTMEKIMGSWIGEPIDSVIDKWGYPTAEKKITEHSLYIWDNGTVMVEGLLGISYTQRPACTRTFEVDSNSIIIKGSWEGMECPATYLTGKKWVNPKNNPWSKE